MDDTVHPAVHCSVHVCGEGKRYGALRLRFTRPLILDMGKTPEWAGYRADVLQLDGTFKREQCWQPLGLVSEQSERSAWRQFQPYLDKENDAAKKLPPRIGLTLAEFVEEWRTNIAVNLKGTTTRAAESHLRAHIIPKLGNYHLPEIMTKIVQGFVAYLAGGGRSRKTTENVLLTLSSLLRRHGLGVMPAEISTSQTLLYREKG